MMVNNLQIYLVFRLDVLYVAMLILSSCNGHKNRRKEQNCLSLSAVDFTSWSISSDGGDIVSLLMNFYL